MSHIWLLCVGIIPLPTKSVPVKCIEVDSKSHLYLAGKGMIPTHNSQMWLNWMTHTALYDSADMMLLQMSISRAREFSLSDWAKLFRNSPDVRAKLVPGRQNDNVYDKTFTSGMRVTVIHPSAKEMAGKTIGRTWEMDYDRIEDDIDGEGDAWTLMSKRGQTLGRYRMNVAESSPSRDVSDPKWLPNTPHEAPPCTGILAKYNEGTRARWYWDCPSCHGKFEGDFKLLTYPEHGSPMERAEQVTMVCPHNGCILTPDMQYELNLGGRWIHEGETWNEDGTVTGVRRKSPVLSYWLKGPAAAFTTWNELVLKYLNAQEDYERTGSETALKAVVNTDLGLPYVPKSIEAGRLPEQLRARAFAYNTRGTVPAGVRFLITTIDVQAGGRPSFVCHTFGIAPVKQSEGQWSVDIYHIDMWKITKSRRLDEDGHPKLIDPASYKEDWHLLIDQVIERKYPLADGSGRVMAVKLVACDSGGAPSQTAARLNAALDGPKVSVTSNAYDFWRFLRDDPDGRSLQRRFHLLKGEPSRSAPVIHVTYPNSQQKDKWAIARGDVPVWAIESNDAKDRASNRIGREEPGGSVQFPRWYDDEGNEEDINWLY
ncbi:MAG: terminase gpA endonuclease subunit, partial [Chloroflexota bacterium]